MEASSAYPQSPSWTAPWLVLIYALALMVAIIAISQLLGLPGVAYWTFYAGAFALFILGPILAFWFRQPLPAITLFILSFDVSQAALIFLSEHPVEPKKAEVLSSEPHSQWLNEAYRVITNGGVFHVEHDAFHPGQSVTHGNLVSDDGLVSVKVLCTEDRCYRDRKPD